MDTRDFAKIVLVDGSQVLFFIENDIEAEEKTGQSKAKLNQHVRYRGIEANVALGGMTYELADKALANADEEYARKVFDTVRNLVDGAADAA